MLKIVFIILYSFACSANSQASNSVNGNCPPTNINYNYAPEDVRGVRQIVTEENIHQGPPGKSGVKGEHGLKGDKGSKGESGQSEDTANQLQQLKDQFDLLKLAFEKLQENLTERLPAKSGIEVTCETGVQYNNHCFRLADVSGDTMHHAEAVTRCADINCALADITNDVLQEGVAAYFRQSFSSFSGNRRWLWLASTYQISGNPGHLITLSNGNRITLSTWRNSYPKTTSTYRNVMLYVHQEVGHEENGVVNAPASSYSGVPLCECNP